MKITLTILLSLLFFTIGCESCERWQKDMASEYGGGLERTLEVYSYDGDLLKKYEGEFDFEITENGRVKADINGKRIIIFNAIVISEEK